MPTRIRTAIFAAVAATGLSGCAATWDGAGPRLGVGLGRAPAVVSASCVLGGTQPSPMVRMSSGAWISGVMPRIQALQMRLSSGAGPQARDYKQVATGEC